MNTHLVPEKHLTDDQFTDLLLGGPSASISAHLDACPACAHEADRVSSAIGSFERQTRLWSEHRAATLPRLVPTPESPLAWLRRPQAWATAAGAVLLAATVTLAHRAESTAPAQQAVVHAAAPTASHPLTAPEGDAAPQVTAATLKADNDLLSAIDGELSADANPPASMYGLDTDTGTDSDAHTRKPLKRSSN